LKFKSTIRDGSLIVGFHSVVETIEAFIAVEEQLKRYYDSQLSDGAPGRPNVNFLQDRPELRRTWYRYTAERKSGAATRGSFLPRMTIKDEPDSSDSSVVG